MWRMWQRGGVDTITPTDYESGVAKKPESSRIPSAVGAIPVVGDLMKQAEGQAQWMQDLVEQNARLIGQFPATMKTFNDSLERFNQTVGRLDRAVTRIEGASKNLTGPVEKLAAALDPKTLRELPETLDAIRREAVPALRAATDTQRQVALLATTVDRVVSVISELPGMGILRRIATGRPEDPTPPVTPPRAAPRTDPLA
jgi:ABC-type transporter Mla subunit MlaD